MEGFEFLREAFAKFADKYSREDIASRIVRAGAAGGKAAVDRGLQEFPKTFISQFAKDVYGLLTSQELADGISAGVRSFDEEKVQEMVDGLASSLKNRDTALDVAKKVKDMLDKFSATDIEGQLDGMMDLAGVPMQMRFIAQVFLSQAQPILEGMKYDSVEDIADKIMALADQIPSDLIAEQVADITRNVTPERISKQANDMVGALPSPQAVADIVHGIGGAVSEHLDQVAKITALDEVSGIVADLAENMADMVSDTLRSDKIAKKTFPNKGGKLEF